MAGRLSFRAWQPVPAVLVSGGLAVVTNLVTNQATVALVVLFVTLAAVQVALAMWQGSHDRVAALTAARARRDEALGPLSLPLPEGASTLLPLTATYCPTMTWGRQRHKRKLITWCTAADAAAPVMVVAGPAGVGKSRLARAVGEELPTPWHAGRWTGQVSAGELVSRLTACPEPVLVIVDDADTVPDVAALLELVALRPGQVRVLLIARDGDGLRDVLRTRVGDGARWLLDPQPLRLEPVGDDGDRRRWFAEAVRAYARQLRVPPPDVADRDNRPVGDEQETMLVLHARALLTVLDRRHHRPPATAVRRLNLPEVAQALLDREIKWWRDTADSSQWGLTLCPDTLLVQAMLALTLLPAATVDDAIDVLSRLPGIADHSGFSRRDLAEWARHRYPAAADGTLDLRPHFVAEWLVASHLASPEQRTLAMTLLTDLAPRAAPSVFAMLARASMSFPVAVGLIGQGIGSSHALLVPALDAVRVVGSHSRDLDRELAALVDSVELTEDEEAAVRARLPVGALPLLGVSLDRQWVARHRRAVARDADRGRAELAAALYQLGISLTDAGSHGEAVVVKREAVDLYRRLLAIGEQSHSADLATGLNNLGVSLADLGQTAEAHFAFGEAVELCRILAAGDPDGYRPALGSALCNLGSSLRDLGRPAESLGPLTEAVDVYRAMIQASPGQHGADLAHALTSLGIGLGDVGRPAEAVVVLNEAATLCRGLGGTDSVRHRSFLAHTLRILGACRSELGRPAEAFVAFTEAVDLGRELFAANPRRHRPALANALVNLGIALSTLGRVTEAFPIDAEAVAQCRELFAANPDRHRCDLAAALSNLSLCLAGLGRADEAFDAATETVALYRESVVVNADRYRPDLARALFNLGVRQWERGQRADALRVKWESVELYRIAVGANAEHHRPELARALAGLGGNLVDAGERDEGFALRAEAVALWKVCAVADPGRFGETYRQEGALLRRAYNERGLALQAITDNLAEVTHPEPES